MSEDNQQATDGTGEVPYTPDELTLLKARAKTMNIVFSNNIGLEALKAKVQAKLDGEAEPEEPTVPETAPETTPNPVVGDPAPAEPVVETKQQMRQRLIKESSALIRCRIQNLDPKKADLPGEIFCVGNEYIGTFRKYIPYGEVTDNGYHIPKILYDELRSRKFQNIKTRKKAGQILVETNWAKEFAIEVLEPLTQEELNRLAAQQAAAGSISDGSGLS